MSWQSTLPAVIDGLLSLLRANETLANVVQDGLTLVDNGGPAVVFVGYDGDENGAVAQGSFQRQGMAVQPDRETYSIRCAVLVVNGAGDVSASRARAFVLLAAVGASIAANPTIDGAVMNASLGQWSFTTDQVKDRGAVATLTFDVDIDAFVKE